MTDQPAFCFTRVFGVPGGFGWHYSIIRFLSEIITQEVFLAQWEFFLYKYSVFYPGNMVTKSSDFPELFLLF